VVKHNLIDSRRITLAVLLPPINILDFILFSGASDILKCIHKKEELLLIPIIMCSQQVQVDNNLSAQVDFVNVDEYEPAFQLIPPFGEYDYKEFVLPSFEI
jgi:hypothetical protein